MDALSSFHPAIQTWFERRFPAGPTPPQRSGWPAIARGEDTLIAAPTGSGKTLSAFLVSIDRIFRAETERLGGMQSEMFAGSGPAAAPSAAPPSSGGAGVQVVYVSPLKALAADVQQNLQTPLEEIRDVARELGLPAPELRVSLRSGDTPSSERAAMLKRPPHLLVTTPESLYLLVTAERSREMLKSVRTVIVDEIHAVARDKRGSHLALTLERLEALCETRPARIGLSATQRPIETVSRLLVGAGEGRSEPDGRPRCVVVDEGHRRELDLAIELPAGELEAVASTEQMAEVLDAIAGHVRRHHTTLVFVNTRRMAERLARELAERLEPQAQEPGAEPGAGARVASHHGSLSRERRLRVEAQLRAGELSALVATASLELGIDIGPVELVCQIGSPRSLATFIQRVGRSGHFLGGTPKGRLYPMTRDELVECAALLRGVARGRLDALHPPSCPLDILAQQIVAACAAEEWSEDDLFDHVRRAAPFASLSRRDYDDVLELLAEGITTGRGRRAAYLHRDRVNGVLRGRRGARIAAITSGGAIPETADYRVVAGHDDTYIGTVGEDFAIESMVGDIFLLGSTSWKIRRVEPGVVRVVDAGGAPSTVPFWLGEAPARTEELSSEVSTLREEVARRLESGDGDGARAWVEQECHTPPEGAQQIVAYLDASRVALGALPTQRRLVFERFFDESGGMQLVVHSPYGGRINRGLGLGLRKKFCASFDFELQAAANDDAVVLSLGPQHSFPLESAARFLASAQVHATLEKAAIQSPMFAARWRWNLNRSLAVLRFRGGRRNPPAIQRMESDDLMAAVFPGLVQCQENATGPVEIPEHPLVRQTLHDCLTEAMDADRLKELVGAIEQGEVDVHFVDTTEPSPMAHEILSGRPYTFLDDAPLEERRTRAVSLRRGLPVQARELGRLDPEAIDRVRDETRPRPRDADELHDQLQHHVVMRSEALGDAHERARIEAWLEELVANRRVGWLEGREASGRGHDDAQAARLWFASERRSAVAVLFPEVELRPGDPGLVLEETTVEVAAADAVRGHLDSTGPVTVEQLCGRTGLAADVVEIALASLESEGFALRGRFTRRESDERDQPDRSETKSDSTASAPAPAAEEFCARRLLARIHAYTQDRLRREIEPVTARDFVRFLLRWQHVAPDTRVEGKRGVLAVIEQLQGFELGAGAWEEGVLSARVESYRPRSLDALCLSGDVVWGRLSARAQDLREARAREKGPDEDSKGASAGPRRSGASPSRATPISFCLRADLPWLLAAQRGEAPAAEPGPGPAADVLALLRARGALFHSDLVAGLDRLPVEVEEGLWDLVARGLVTADGFQAVRSLLGARERWARTRVRRRARRGLRRGIGGAPGAGAEGRWSLFPHEPAAAASEDPDELAEAVAEQLLARWGVVFYDLLARESLAIPWREVLWALRRLEARGVIRGGRFVSGFVGEQFALPEAVESLRRVRRRERSGEVVRVSAVDPLNLVGILTDGPRVPAVRTREVIYRDGAPISEEELAAESR